MVTDRYEEVRLGAERARGEARAGLEAAQRRGEEIAARLAELRSGNGRDPARDGAGERYVREAHASLEVARDRDRRSHERAARLHDRAVHLHDAAAEICEREGDGLGAARARAASVRERQAAEQDRQAARRTLWAEKLPVARGRARRAAEQPAAAGRRA